MNRDLKIIQIAALSAAAVLLAGCKKPPPLGACCSADGACSNIAQAACMAAWRAGSCSPNPCPPPPPPPAVEISLDTVAQELKADARVQFSPDLKVTEENLPLGKAIVHLADALARGDSKALKPMLTRRAQGLLDDLTSSGGWDEGTKQIEAVRVVFVRDGVDMGAIGSAHTPAGEVTAGLMAKVTDALKDLPPEQLAAIMKAATEAMAGADPATLVSNPAKLAEVQGKLAEAAKNAGLSDEIVAKLAAIGKDAPAEGAAPAEAPPSGGSGLGVLIAIQDLHGAYLLGWQAEKVGDGWAFTNAPATPEVRPRASLWDNVGPEGFQAMTLASAPAMPMGEDGARGKDGKPGEGGGGGGGGSPPGESPPGKNPTAPPSRAPGSPGRPPGSGSPIGG